MEDLIQRLDANNGHDPEQVFEIIDQINSYYLNLVDYTKIDQDLACAFPLTSNQDGGCGGVLHFLKSQITLKPHDKAKEQAYQLLSWIIQNSRIPRPILQQYIVRFKEIADLTWKNQNERSRIQNAALEVLINILKYFGPHFKSHELEAAHLYQNLLVNSERSCFQPSVRGQMFHLLGLLANCYANDIMDREEKYNQLFNHLVLKLKEEVECEHRHLEASILLGTLRALDSFLHSFGSRLNVTSENILKLYKKLEQIVDPKCSIDHNAEDTNTTKLKRREFQRAGLELVSNHGSLFAKYLAQYHEQWFSDLLSWIKSNNIDDSRVGIKAMFKFIESVSLFYGARAGPGPEEETSLIQEREAARIKAVNFFREKFRNALDSSESHAREVTVAVKGYGLIAQICQDDEFADDLMFKRIMKRIESILGEMDAPSESKSKYEKYGPVSSLPTYVEAIGRILFSMTIQDEESLATFHNRLLIIEELSISLVTHFPRLSEKYRAAAYHSFNEVLKSLHMRHYKWCRPFLEKVVQEALTHTIASPTKTEVDILTESYTSAGNDKELKKLNLHTVQSYVKFWINLMKLPTQHPKLTTLTYDALMQWMLETIRKLDLSLEFVDPEEAMEVEDISIDPVYNTKATTARDFQLFINLVEFMETLVSSTDSKLFSKWVDVLMDEAIMYVEKFPLVSGFYKIIALTFDMIRELEIFENLEEEEDGNAGQLLKKCSEFVKTLTAKTDEFRDDLLLSVLNVWLSAPHEIIARHFAHLGETMKKVFRVGRTSLSLAARGVDALDRWFLIDKISPSDIELLFQELFPILKSYFTAVGQEEMLTDIIKMQATKQKAGKTNSFKKAKGYLHQRRIQQMAQQKEDVTLRDLQLSLLKLFGSYAHLLNLNSIYATDAQVQMNVEERFLTYAIPFQDIKPDLYLEVLLPRIIELCNLASDRQLRSSACECLHSIVLYFLGHSVHSSSSAGHGELFAKIFSTMMKLGCDNDTVVGQLFNPLTIQVVHWFTRNDAQNYGDIVLQLIADSLVQTENTHLRDFSAVCMSEFFTWCMKHSNSSKVKQVMKTLCAMGTHSAPKYRQGSVLAFNSIYLEFRENEELVSTYTLQLVHSFIVSLGLPYSISGESILVKSTELAIRHLEKILLKKKDKFNTNIRGRKYPAELGGPCLNNLVNWLLRQCSQSSTAIGRQVCMSLIHTQAPNIRGVGTTEEFLFGCEKENGVQGMLQICETYPESPEGNTMDTCSNFERLLKSLDASVDIYLGLQTGGYPIAKLLGHTESRFTKKVVRFLEFDTMFFPTNSTALAFLTKLGQLINSTNQCFSLHFKQSYFTLGLTVSKMAPGNLEILLTTLNKVWLGLSDVVSMEFTSDMKQLMQLNPALVEPTLQVNLSQVEQLIINTNWCHALIRHSGLTSIVPAEERRAVAGQIWNHIMTSLFYQKAGRNEEVWVSKPVNFKQRELLQSLSKLCFGLGWQDGVIFAVFDSTPVYMDTVAKTKLTKGDVLQQVLLPTFCFSDLLANFQHLLTQTKLENVGRLIPSILTFVKDNREIRKRYGKQLVDSTLGVWQQLHLNIEPSVLSRIMSGLSSLDFDSCKNSKQLATWWSGPMLMANPNLTLKEKSEFIHFFGLFGRSSDPDVLNTCIKGIEILVKQSLHLTNHVDWTQEQQYISKVFYKMVFVYESMPENIQLLEIIVKYLIKSAVLCESLHEKNLEKDPEKTELVTNEPENTCATEIRSRLRRLMTENPKINEEIRLQIIETIFKTITDPQNTEFRMNLSGNTFCLLPAIGVTTDTAFKRFFRQNVLTITCLAEAAVQGLAAKSVWNLKTIGMTLIEMLALRSPLGFIFGNDLNQCYVRQLSPAQLLEVQSSKTPAADDPRILYRKLMKISQGYRSVRIPSQRDRSVRTANFNFNVASFNATVALAKAGDLKPLQITGFVFVDNRKPGDIIWSNIVDTRTKYTYPILMDPALSEKKIVEEKSARTTNATEISFEHNHRGVVSESSLANDASRFDFTTSIKVATSPFYQKIFAGINPYDHTPTRLNLPAPEGTLEWSQVNEHPCMFSLIQAMKQIASAPASAGRAGAEEWVIVLKSLLENSTVHANIKALLIGAMMNSDDVFKPYASHFIEPIIKCIISEAFPTSVTATTSQGLNYFVKDIIIMLLGWSEIAKLEKSQVKSFLEYIITRIDNPRKDVLENSLQLLQSIFTHWVKNDTQAGMPYDERLIPHNLISQALGRSDSATSVTLGLNLSKYFCLSGILPCELDNVANFVDLIANSFRSSSKTTNSLGGEAAGLLLKVLDAMDYAHIDKALKRLKEKKLDRERGRTQPYLAILSSIGKHYLPFLILFKNDVTSFLKNAAVRDEALNILVDVFQEEISKESSQDKKDELMRNLHADLEGRGIFNMELKTDLKAGVEYLFIASNTNLMQKKPKVLQLLGWTQQAEFGDSVIRARYATAVSQIYSNVGGHSTDEAISSKCEKLFIRLLFDEDLEVQKVVQEFWSNNLKSWATSPSLLLELMEILGDNPNAVAVLLELMMKRCSSSPDFVKDIFDKDLADCVFQNYDINTSWRGQQSSMHPLFAESLSSSQSLMNIFPKAIQSSLLSQRAGSQLGMNVLRSTLRNLQFTQTQDRANADGFSQSQGDNMQMDEAFDFDLERSDPTKNSSPDQSRPQNALNSLRRRFYERSETPFYAIREVKRQQTIIESDVETLRKRRSGVKLSRSYRIGELPDIRMKNSDFLASVIALVKKDEELGKTLLVVLGSAFLDELKKTGGDGAFAFRHNASIVINKLFTAHGAELGSQFAAALLEMSATADISVKPSLISSVSGFFGLEQIGILKFENEIVNATNAESSVPPKRARLANDTSDVEIWLRLGELYKHLEDFDTVRNVFSHIRDLYKDNQNKQDYFEKAREALYLESLSKYLEAQEHYDELYTSDTNEGDPLLQQLFDDAIYKVLASMSDWDGQYTRTHQFYIQHQEEIRNDSYRARILPKQILSGVQTFLRHLVVPDEGAENVGLFSEFLQSLKEDEDEWKAVAARFPIDLSILHLIEDDDNKSRALLDTGWSRALLSFQSFERLSKNEKRDCFLELQKSSTLSDALAWLTTMRYSVTNIEDRTCSLVEKWRRSTSSATMPLLNADLLVPLRSAILQLMAGKLENLMLEDKEELVDDIARLQFEQKLWVVNLASIDGNSDVGNYYLGHAKKHTEGCDEEELLTWRKSLCKLLTTCASSYTMKDWTRQWTSSWKKLAKLERDGGSSKIWEVQGELLQSLIQKLTKGQETLSKRTANSIAEAFDAKEPIGEYAVLMNTVLNDALLLIGKATGDEESSQDIVSNSSETALKFYHLIKSILDAFPDKYARSEVLHEQMLLCLFHAMKGGQGIARQLFPYCFGILEKFPNLIGRLTPQIISIDAWIFLPWLDQITTYYKHKPILRPLLKPILQNMIREYPQAFQLQYSDLDLIITSSGFPPVLAHFEKALKALALPHILLGNLIKAVKSCSAAEQLRTQLAKLISGVQKIDETTDYFGSIHREYAQEILPKLNASYQELGQGSIGVLDVNRIRDDLIKTMDPTREGSSLKKNIFDGPGQMKEYLSLKHLSPWLAKYHFSSFPDGIELPGLYRGIKKPESSTHPYIVSFESTVKVYQSLTRPLGLTLMANNGKRYKFLLKFGDDLRQDKRLQQLFSLFNQILANDSRCRERDLRILTYEVIPMSKEFGMIELVDKTKSLKDFVLKSAQHRDIHLRCSANYSKFISKTRTNPGESYGIFAGRSRNEVEALFDKASNFLPKTLFSTNVKLSAESSVSYFLLREKLIRSHATMCIIHYLLGIGDRHLDNIMLKLSSGQFLGIDFGHAFGSATVSLAVPELVPFRLTPQLQNLMSPYGVNGIFKEAMMYSWRAIKKSSELVSSVVEIFIAEPTIDWSRNVKAASATSKLEGTSAIKLLRDKLASRNPLEITEKMLRMNNTLQSNETYMRNWQTVLKDGREENSKIQTLTDEQLVDTLISLATDRNVLGKMYVGWSSWV